MLFGFGDHQAPPFELLVQFCKDAKTWLDKDTSNIVVIHCKAGKGRTGTMIAALLLYLGQATDADEAIRIYGTKRTIDGKVCDMDHSNDSVLTKHAIRASLFQAKYDMSTTLSAG